MLKMTIRLSLFLFIPLLAACEGNQGSPQQGLLYCAEGNPEAFNPQQVTSGTTIDMTAGQLYDRLLDYDSERSAWQPALATSWEVSEDGLEYRFTLRDDVAFHEQSYFSPTRHLNADDVVFSINRWRDASHPFHFGPLSFFRASRLAERISNVQATDTHEVTIQLSRPDHSLLAILASNFSVILSAEYGDQLKAAGTPEQLDQKPIGTGPFKFAEFRKDALVRYHRNPAYWGGEVTPEQLVYRIIPSDHKRMLMLLTEDCDVSPYPPARDLNWLQGHSKVALQQAASPNTAYWAFNTEREPFNDPLVRQALSLAVNREALIESVYSGHADLAHSILPPTSWAFADEQRYLTYDPERARALLAEAGYADGFEMTIWALPVQRAYNPNARLMAERMQSDLAEVNIDVDIVSYEWSLFRRRLSAGEHDSVLIGWSADYPDPDNFLGPLLSCPAVAAGSNRALWCEPDFDELLNQALSSPSQTARQGYYQQAQAMLAEAMPVVPIAHSHRYLAHRPGVENITVPVYGGVKVWQVEFREEAQR